MASTPMIPLGVGIYTVTDAAQLLGIHKDRVRRWVRGYRYYPLGVAASEIEDLRLRAGGLSFQSRDLSSYRTDKAGTRSVLLLDDLSERLGVKITKNRASGPAAAGLRVS